MIMQSFFMHTVQASYELLASGRSASEEELPAFHSHISYGNAYWRRRGFIEELDCVVPYRKAPGLL